MKVLITLLTFLTVANLFAQKGELDYEFGGGFHYQINTHNGDFTKLNEIPNCCPRFSDGSGSGFDGFLFYKMPLIDKLSGQLRLGFSTFDAKFIYTEFTKVSVDDEAVDGEFTHTLNADFSGLYIQPIFSYKLFDNLNINAGMNMSYLLSGAYDQIEEITKPSDRGTYIDPNGIDTELREWNKNSGDIPKLISLQMGVLGGISYDLPMNSKNTMWISPEIYYSYGLTDIAEETPWTVNSLLLGLTLKYRPNPKIEVQRPGAEEIIEGQILAREIELSGNQSDIYFGEFNIPGPVKEEAKVKLDANITAVGVAEGQEHKQATMVIEEFLSTNMRPLLNYVFFDNNSSELPERYLLYDEKKAEKFSRADLSNLTTLRTYYDLLNIIGLRMKENPEAKVELTGCNMGRERGGLTLSQKRADIVREYLLNVWKIDPARLSTQARNLPELPSNQSTKDGVEENRRAEIHSDSWEIMKPVLTEDTLRKVSPPIIRFYLNTESENEISKWKVTALQNGDVLKVIEGEGKVPEKIDWNIDREKETVPKFSDSIEYMIEVEDSKGNQSFSETGLLPTNMITIQTKKENRLGDKRIDRYSLILFDFDSDSLGSTNMRIVDFIKGNLQSNSRLLISGFTDRMGDAPHNEQLSKNRAESVSRYLDPRAYTRGVGESLLIYDNDLPEGRFYCRTVEIEVETPISWNK